MPGLEVRNAREDRANVEDCGFHGKGFDGIPSLKF